MTYPRRRSATASARVAGAHLPSAFFVLLLLSFSAHLAGTHLCLSMSAPVPSHNFLPSRMAYPDFEHVDAVTATAVSGIYTRQSLLNDECWEGVRAPRPRPRISICPRRPVPRHALLLLPPRCLCHYHTSSCHTSHLCERETECVCACVRACACVRVHVYGCTCTGARACVRACLRACVVCAHVCVRECVNAWMRVMTKDVHKRTRSIVRKRTRSIVSKRTRRMRAMTRMYNFTQRSTQAR